MSAPPNTGEDRNFEINDLISTTELGKIKLIFSRRIWQSNTLSWESEYERLRNIDNKPDISFGKKEEPQVRISLPERPFI